MYRRFRAVKAWPTLLAVTLGALVFGPTALADTYNDIDNWNLSETVTQAGGGTVFHIGSGSSGFIQYRWLDSPNKSTVISANDCNDFHVIGSASSYGVADTSYHTLGSGIAGQCFVLQGRTQPGQGTMFNHDGRVLR